MRIRKSIKYRYFYMCILNMTVNRCRDVKGVVNKNK